MGNTQYREQQLQQYQPQMHNYTLKHCYSPLSIYRNIYNNEEIMEFKERVYNSQDLDRRVQTFLTRHQHIYLVSSLYLKIEAATSCGNPEYQLSIYYERIVTNFSKINQLSFKDSIHCLAVALKGFQILYKSYGYFEIFQNMFHICQRGRLKVWCNQNIYKNVPQQYLLGQGKQQQMVLKIINIVDQNIDETCRVFPIRQALGSLKKLTFSNAIIALRQICRQNQFIISQSLESLQNFSQFQTVLDIYKPAPKRFPKDIYCNSKVNKDTTNNNINRSNSNSTHKAEPRSVSSPTSKNIQIHNKTKTPSFKLNLQKQDGFPKFIVGRPKNLSKSISSSNLSHSIQRLQPSKHNHLQQFNKIKEDSNLKKRYIPPPQNNQIHFQKYHISQPNQTIYRPQSHIQKIPESSILHYPHAPQPFSRYVGPSNENSKSQFKLINNPNIIPYHYQGNIPNPANIIRVQHPVNFIKPSIIPQKRELQPTPPAQIAKIEYKEIQKRAKSVPIKVSYQGMNIKQVQFSPSKYAQQKQDYRINTNKDRLVTLGQASEQKNKFILQRKLQSPLKQEKKLEKIQIAQLQSKIQLLDSFAENKITTNQFLPNQSHALSNIKWEKSSNSGRDSVTSAFRKDILPQLSYKFSQKKNLQDWQKQDSILKKSSKFSPKFEDFYTNQRLLDLIKSNSQSSFGSFSKNAQERLKKYEGRYNKQDYVKQLTKDKNTQKSNKQYQEMISKYSVSSPGNIFEQQKNKNFTFGLNENFGKKKPDNFNKIYAISEKFQEENICSTSNGSHGINIGSSNIDQDILEDMQNEGFGMFFHRK